MVPLFDPEWTASCTCLSIYTQTFVTLLAFHIDKKKSLRSPLMCPRAGNSLLWSICGDVKNLLLLEYVVPIDIYTPTYLIDVPIDVYLYCYLCQLI